MVEITQLLEHDHVHLSQLVFGVRDALVEGGRVDVVGPEFLTELVRKVEELRDDLLLHFAQEEEGLFPYVVEHVPDAKSEVDRLQAAHDMICGTVVRMAYAARNQDRSETERVSTVAMLFERFLTAYQAHAPDEVVFLRDLSTRLSDAERLELAEIVRTL